MVFTQAEVMEQKNAQQIKVSFGEEIRRFTISGNSFKVLLDDIKRIFNLKEETTIIVKYQDEDEDLITMSSDEELQTALTLVNKNLLRLQISRKYGKRPKHNEEEDKEEEPKKEEKDWRDRTAWKERKEKVKQFRERFQAMQQVRLVKDVTFSENAILAPSTQFVKTWKIRNESSIAWPEGCTLVFHKGDNMGNSASIPVPPVAPGQEVDLSITLSAPSTFGKYLGVWRLTTPPFANWKGETVQKKFGTPLKVKILVSDSSSSELSNSSSDSESSSSEEENIKSEKKKEEKKEKKEEKKEKKKLKKQKKELKKRGRIEEMNPLLTQLESMGFSDKKLNLKILNKTHGDLDKAVVKLLKKKNKAQK